jgi:bifunctional non-homologous end joining protein LigD
MTLETYRQKRNFKKTPEPPPEASERAQDGRAGDAPALRFVVQKHAASHLHYDFRLELDGALKSWAVPKGPSLNPEDKRLAMMVEDHPMDYRTFEGIIPEGNYGAGTVMVWDEGTYTALGAETREESEKLLREQMGKGSLKFSLRGEKLKGAYSLSKMRGGKEENAWLLIKKQDDFATKQDVLLWNRSVLSGRDMEEIAEARDAVWRSNRDDDALRADNESRPQPEAHPAPASTQPRTMAFAPPQIAGIDLSRIDLTGAVRAEMPHDVKPMLATLTDEPFDRDGWLFELKWDGYRAVAELKRGDALLYSRNMLSYNERYGPVVRDLEKLPFDAVLDGEVVVLNSEGRPEFKLLQNWLGDAAGRIVYYVFDIIYLEGYDLCSLPLLRRKAILKAILPETAHVRWSDYIERNGRALYDAARGQGLEGVIAKDGASQYRAGDRTEDWLKIKTHLRQSAVICGFTEPRGGRKDLGALILGVYEDEDGEPTDDDSRKQLVYIGHTGGGFTEADLAHVKERLEPLIAKRSPFAIPPPTNAPPTWTRPELVCDVKFAEWSKDGMMRQPIFIGLRDDIDPLSVCRELPVPLAKATKRRYKRKEAKPETVTVDGRTIEITNPDKLYFPDDGDLTQGLTKRDVVGYYRGIAPLILPHLVDRPQSLHRFPNGINGESFFQKDVGGQVPGWVETVVIGDDDDPQEYLLCQDEATLTLMANMGCIEVNAWNSRRQHLDNPDYLVIDLDPLDISFAEVVKAALEVHRLLDAAEIPNYIKTSGATGLHIFSPLGAQYPYDQVREFGRLVAYLVNDRLPETTSVERSPEKRKGKVYLDFLQNRRGQTMAAVYSLRPRPGAPVATPLLWEEVRPGMTPSQFNIRTLPERLAKHGDLFGPVLGEGIDMAASLARLEKVALARGR